MRYIAETPEELDELVNRLARPDMTEAERDGLSAALEEEATDWWSWKHGMCNPKCGMLREMASMLAQARK